jgi:hypothetical protein
MAKPTTSWKNTERKVAKLLGGTRTGRPGGTSLFSGIEDVSHPLFSIEVKHGKKSIPKLFGKAYNISQQQQSSWECHFAVVYFQDFVCIEAKDLRTIITGKSCDVENYICTENIPKFFLDAYKQAKKNAGRKKIPLVVLHEHNSTDYLCILSNKDFQKVLEK